MCLLAFNMIQPLSTVKWFFYLHSGKCDYQARSSRLNLKLCESARPTKCFKSCIKVFSIREYRGELGEVDFIKVFFRGMRALKSAYISMANLSFAPFSMAALPRSRWSVSVAATLPSYCVCACWVDIDLRLNYVLPERPWFLFPLFF
jgi:hypothetical protein